MTTIVLVCVLGVALVVYLLFRRLRQLSWQLTQLRVEHDSEQILRAIGVPPQIGVTMSEPVRRKHHLRGYRGGGAPIALTGLLEGLRRHRVGVVLSAGMVAAAVTTALVLDTTARSQEANGASSPPTSAPEVAAPLQAEPLVADDDARLEPAKAPASGKVPAGAGSPAVDVALAWPLPDRRESRAPEGARPPLTAGPTPPPITALPAQTPAPESTVSTRSDALCVKETVPLLLVPCLPGRT